MMHCSLGLFLVFLALPIQHCKGSKISIALCIAKERALNLFSWSSCAAGKFNSNFDEMKTAGCINCDKYFHCMANYEAVFSCTDTHRTKTARLISDCRDDPSCTDQDCKNDREANLFGRNGGDCGLKYLCSYNCKYNPADRTCKKSNCP